MRNRKRYTSVFKGNRWSCMRGPIAPIFSAASAAMISDDRSVATTLAREALQESERLGLQELAYRAALLLSRAARKNHDSVMAQQAETATAKHVSALVAMWGQDALTKY